jgi:hypothetical protein
MKEVEQSINEARALKGTIILKDSIHSAVETDSDALGSDWLPDATSR